MTNLPHIIEVALLILVAFLLGCVIGYYLRRLFTQPQQQAEPVREAAPAPAAAAPKAAPRKARPAAKTAPASPVADAEGRPAGLESPREGGKDNLKLIKGIGPKIESQLNDLGIFHFDQIAGWDRKTIRWVDGYLSFKGRIDREKWVPQARGMAREKS